MREISISVYIFLCSVEHIIRIFYEITVVGE